MAKKDPKEKARRSGLPFSIVFLLILGFILGGGAVWQQFMVKKDMETFPPPGMLLENVPLIDLSKPSPTPDPDVSPSPEPTAEEDAAAAEEETATEETKEPKPEKTGSLHIFVTGEKVEGRPTVLLLGGWGNVSPLLTYAPLIDLLKDHTRVIVFERPGYGWSGKAFTTRSLENMMADLLYALSSTGETGPFVVVAQTTAGLEALHLAHAKPEMVSGVAFIDAMPPAAYVYKLDGALDFLKAYTYPVPRLTGIFRAIGIFAPHLFVPGELVEPQPYIAMYARNVMSNAMRMEAHMLSSNIKTAMTEASLSVPVVAIVDTKAYNANPELHRLWAGFNGSVGATVIESEQGENMLQLETQVIADAILTLVG